MQPDDSKRSTSRQPGGREDDAPRRHAPDPEGGIDREVGDLEDPAAEDDGALPGRVGGGMAGG